MRVSRAGLRIVPGALCGLLALQGVFAPAASAFDPFGWFREKQPEVTQSALPYELAIRGLEDDRVAADAVRDVSLMHRLRREPPVDGDELARRAEADVPRIVDALWGSGYYAARAEIRIAGAQVKLEGGTAGARAAGERFRGRALVPVEVVIEPGPLYRFRAVGVVDKRSAQPFATGVLPRRPLVPQDGDPARTADVLAAAARLSDHFRAAGHPFVRVTRRQPVIDHRTRTVDLSLAVDPGPVAGLGRIGVAGTKDVDAAVVRSFIYAEPGDPYSPRALSDIRKSVARIEAIGSVRVREGEALDADGNLPLTVEVTERLPRVIGGSLRYSTVDGPAVRAYWAHRNLFGGAERLRLEADLFYSNVKQLWAGDTGRSFTLDDLGGRLSASFLKPALWGSRNDLVVDLTALRERTDEYTARLANATAGIRHRVSDRFWLQGAVEGEIGRSVDPLGTFDYRLVGLPMSVLYDSTDRPLDATRGVKLSASAGPYLGFGSAPDTFGIGKLQASTYYALDEDARYVIAARIGFGSVVGGSLGQLPAARRFYAGGGGSVRGYQYKSLGPRDPRGYVIGGKSLFEASLEARIKVTDTIGIVPFVDIGQAFESTLPDGSEKLRIGAGLGLRYYTAIGPIRVDVATPIDRRRGEKPYALYVSLGQSF
jgi:translocation and assembly module TamA